MKTIDKKRKHDLARSLPDIPRWVETRSMLMSGDCELVGPIESAPPAFIVRRLRTGLMAVVGLPSPGSISSAADGCETILAPPETTEHVLRALDGWTAAKALLHLPGESPFPLPDPRMDIRMIGAAELERGREIPPELREELLDACSVSPVAAVFSGSEPVSFCYPTAITETLWDVSIDTLRQYRNRGYARAAVLSMIEFMRISGRRPVWGAEVSNLASIGLARKLGFVVVDELNVIVKPEGEP